MPTLEKICEKTHPTPTLLKPDFSVFLLQNGVMMTKTRTAQKLGAARRPNLTLIPGSGGGVKG